MLQVGWTRFILLFLLIASAGCATMPNGPTPLVPFGPSAEAPATIRFIEPDSPAASHVEKGDTITAVDGKAVNTWSFLFALNSNTKNVQVVSKDGTSKNIPIGKLEEQENGHLYALPFEPGQSIVFSLRNPVYHVDQNASLFYLRNSMALVSASIWPTKPRYLELYLELRVNTDCTDCELNDIAALDLSRKSWLTPVPTEYAAMALYPLTGSAPGLMAVPPPTPIGQVSSTSLTGLFNAYNYGNTSTGSFSGEALTSTTQNYDYTLTNMALAYNLGAVIQQSNIQASNNARRTFILERVSNLRIGHLNPGERVTGFAYFQIPEGFDGPFLVGLKSGKFIFCKFDMPRPSTTKPVTAAKGSP